VQTYLTQKLAETLSEKYHTSITVKGVSIVFFDKILLEEVLVKDQKQDSLLFVKELVAKIDSFSLKKRFVVIDKLNLNNTRVYVDADSLGKPNYQFLLNSSQTKDTIKAVGRNFELSLKQFDFNDALVKYSYLDSIGEHQIYLDKISLGVSDFKINDEKMAFRINRFQLNNRKDFSLDDFSAWVEATPDSISLKNLHIQTVNSEISEANVFIDKSKVGQELDFKKLKINLDLKSSRIREWRTMYIFPVNFQVLRLI